MSFDWKSLVRTVAPTVATALGGPLAGMAVREVSGMVLGRPDGTEDEIAAVLAGGDPEVLLKLKEAEQSFRARMKEAGIKEEQLRADDRADARAREKALKDWTPAILAYFILSAAFICAGWVVYQGDKVDSTLAGMVMGYLFSEAKQVTTYYFGSSKGSSDKNRMFEGMLKRG